MGRIKELLSSPLLLGIATVALLGGAVAAVFPAADYIVNRSVSTTDNLYLIGGLTALAALASVAEAMLAVRLIWGREAIVGVKQINAAEDEDDAPSVGALRATGTKKVLVLGVILGINIIALDQIGQGILITGTRRHHVLTQLRSSEGQMRADAVADAIQLVGDPEVAAALGKIIDTPGEAREWAAYAAGVRHDESLAGSLAELLRTGSPRERAAAAVALARLKDPRLIRLVVDAYPQAGELGQDLLIALGMLGKRPEITSDKDLAEGGGFLAQLLDEGELGNEETLVAIWALGQLESPEGLPYLERLMQKGVGVEAQCTGIQALGKIGSAESSDWLVALIEVADKQARCPELVASDFTGHEVLVCGGINLIERIVREIANIGDRQSRTAMERLSENQAHSETVRKMAEEIAYQLRYAPVPQQ